MLTALYVLRHVAEFTLFILAIFAYGWVLTRALPFRDGLEQAVFACALGTGVLASLLNLLGLAGWLLPGAILAVVVAPAAVTLVFWKRVRPKPLFLEPFEQAGALLLGGTLLATLALALYPPTSFDATLYHLPVAKAFSQRHTISFLADLRFPVFPQLYELLFAASLSLSDGVAAQLTHFAGLALIAAGLLAAGRRPGFPRAGLWAAAAWLGSPLVLGVSAGAYVDTGTALFAAFSIFAWLAWRDDGDVRWLTAAGAFAGFAASTKYLGLFFVAVLPAAALLGGPRPGRLRRALRVAVAALFILAPFYGRILAWTGNPVFPYFSRLFGATAWSQSIDPLASREGPPPAEVAQVQSRLARLVAQPGRIARIPWKLVTPDAGFSRGTVFSPTLLLLAPFLLAAFADPRLRPLAGLTFAYGLLWYLLGPDRRYLFPIFPAGLLASTVVLDRALRRWRPVTTRRQALLVSAGVSLVFLLPGLAWAGQTLRHRGWLPMTTNERDRYLAKYVPAYPAIAGLNRTLADRYTLYGLFCANAGYFAEGRFLGDYFGQERYALVLDSLSDARRLHATLRGMGATHLLTCPGTQPVELPVGAEFQTLFRPLASPPGMRLFALAGDGSRAPVSSPPPVTKNP